MNKAATVEIDLARDFFALVAFKVLWRTEKGDATHFML